MKNKLLVALFAAFWSTATWAAGANPDVGDTHESLAEEGLKAITNVADELAKIKDKETADKAKTELKKISDRIADLKTRLDKLGEPTGEKKEELNKKFAPKMEEALKKARNELTRIHKIEGGPEILKDLTAVLGPIKK